MVGFLSTPDWEALTLIGRNAKNSRLAQNLGLYPGVLVGTGAYRNTKLVEHPASVSYVWKLQNEGGVIDPTDECGNIHDTCRGGSSTIPLSEELGAKRRYLGTTPPLRGARREATKRSEYCAFSARRSYLRHMVQRHEHSPFASRFARHFLVANTVLTP